MTPDVHDAVFSGNRYLASKLGRKGAEAKKAKRTAELNLQLRGAREKLRQGNEHICPIDD